MKLLRNRNETETAAPFRAAVNFLTVAENRRNMRKIGVLCLFFGWAKKIIAISENADIIALFERNSK
jgi:hypothetical protein